VLKRLEFGEGLMDNACCRREADAGQHLVQQRTVLMAESNPMTFANDSEMHVGTVELHALFANNSNLAR